jgi:MFS family permease
MQNLEADVDKSVELGAPKEIIIPDGGKLAWGAVVGSFLIHVVALGIHYSFGIFLLHYGENNFKGRASSSQISLIGTLGYGVMFFIAVLSGRSADSFGFSKTVGCGALLIGLGYGLAAFSTHLWHLYITQGIIVGLGTSLIYFPAIAVIAQWWDKKLPLANGLAMAGSGFGGMTYSALTQVLLDRLDTSRTLLILGAISLGLLGIALCMMKTRIVPTSTTIRKVFHSLFTMPTIKNRELFIPLLGIVFIFPFGYLVPIYYLPCTLSNCVRFSVLI